MRDDKRFIPASVKRILDSALEIGNEEQIGMVRLARLGDERAIEKLTLANIKFVVSRALHLSGKWNLPDSDYEDILSTVIFAGIEGMYKAFDYYDETKSCFLTYAKWYIDKYIRKAIIYECRCIRVGTDYALSLDDEIGEDGEDLLSMVADEGPSVEEMVENSETIREMRRAVSKLEKRSRDILLGTVVGGKRHKVFCDKYNICDERVRQIVKDAKREIMYRIAC